MDYLKQWEVRVLLTLSLKAVFSFSLTSGCLIKALVVNTFTVRLGLNGDACQRKRSNVSLHSTSYLIHPEERMFLCKKDWSDLDRTLARVMKEKQCRGKFKVQGNEETAKKPKNAD